jgi:two-component system cell cycle response regulator DivK
VKKRILVAEDNEDMALILHQLLESHGHEVALARDGVETVEMATSQLPDLIIMDITLPKMDGLQATSRIRRNPKTQAIPILAVTAKAMEGDQQKCLASGCDGYISKPFTVKELRGAIERLLKNPRQGPQAMMRRSESTPFKTR